MQIITTCIIVFSMVLVLSPNCCLGQMGYEETALEITSLVPDLPSPQPPASKITWTATVSNPGGFDLEYRFELSGPRNSGVSQVVRDWSSDNTWKWDSGISDIGDNKILVEVRDKNLAMSKGLDVVTTVSGLSYADFSIKPTSNHPPILLDPKVTPEKPLLLYSGDLVYSVTYEDEDGDKPTEIWVNIGTTTGKSKIIKMEQVNIVNEKPSYKALYKVKYNFKSYGEWLTPDFNKFYIYCNDGIDSTQTNIIDGPIAQNKGEAKIKCTIEEISTGSQTIKIGENRIPYKIFSIKTELVDGPPGCENWYGTCIPTEFKVIDYQDNILKNYLEEVPSSRAYRSSYINRYVSSQKEYTSNCWFYEIELDRPFLMLNQYTSSEDTKEYIDRMNAINVLFFEYGLQESMNLGTALKFGKKIGKTEEILITVPITILEHIATTGKVELPQWSEYLEGVNLVTQMVGTSAKVFGLKAQWECRASMKGDLIFYLNDIKDGSINLEPNSVGRLKIIYKEGQDNGLYRLKAFPSWDQGNTLLELGSLDADKPCKEEFIGMNDVGVDDGDTIEGVREFIVPNEPGEYKIKVVYERMGNYQYGVATCGVFSDSKMTYNDGYEDAYTFSFWVKPNAG